MDRQFIVGPLLQDYGEYKLHVTCAKIYNIIYFHLNNACCTRFHIGMV